MMISNPSATSDAFVWIWLPNATTPVVAGRLVRSGHQYHFTYGRTYLDRPNAIPIFLPDLPLIHGPQRPGDGQDLAGCLRDAAPDAWGRRVILNHLLGIKGRDTDPGTLDELTYLLQSGSDRIGALDFQSSSQIYSPRSAQTASLTELLTAVDAVERGIPLTPDLDQALFHGTSLGGARPKAQIQDHSRKLIAKFSSSSDLYNVVKAEFIAMRLAARAGLDVAPVDLVSVAGKNVLLIERFDRIATADGWQRRAMVSALTLFGFDEMMARYASYQDLTEIIRHRFTNPGPTLQEIFGRLVFNILCGNNDDHARNHAAFWDGQRLTLTPAYDLCPQNRTGNETSQAMLITGQDRRSMLTTCIAAAPHFQLDVATAEQIIAHQIAAIRSGWPDITTTAGLSEADQRMLWGRIIFNPSIFVGAPPYLHALAHA